MSPSHCFCQSLKPRLKGSPLTIESPSFGWSFHEYWLNTFPNISTKYVPGTALEGHGAEMLGAARTLMVLTRQAAPGDHFRQNVSPGAHPGGQARGKQPAPADVSQWGMGRAVLGRPRPPSPSRSPSIPSPQSGLEEPFCHLDLFPVSAAEDRVCLSEGGHPESFLFTGPSANKYLYMVSFVPGLC